jgi:hypothetical protein
VTDIPDDVVERAKTVFLESYSDYPPMTVAMRAAGRVFVEWERERLLGEVRHLEEDGLNGGWRMRTAKEIKAAILSHTTPDDCNPSDYT